jgi:hypothetical protein
MPNCMIRGVPPLVVMRPDCVWFRLTAGRPQLKLFVTLNASSRSSGFRSAPKLIMRDSATLICQAPGPSTPRYSRFPNLPGAGAAKAARFK